MCSLRESENGDTIYHNWPEGSQKKTKEAKQKKKKANKNKLLLISKIEASLSNDITNAIRTLISRSSITLPLRVDFPHVSDQHTTLVYFSDTLVSVLVTFCSCQSSYVVFFILFLMISPLCFPHTIFSFERNTTESFPFYLCGTSSTNFLVCSKCVIGDSQQDRNARAYFLVKTIETATEYRNKTIQKIQLKKKV